MVVVLLLVPGLLRSPEAESLLVGLINRGAGGSDLEGVYMPDDEPALLELLDRGFVRSMGGDACDSYTLTPAFRTIIRSGLTVEKPVPLHSYARPDASLNGMTSLELLRLLAQDGWVDVQVASPKQMSAFQPGPGSEKVWYRTATGTVSHLYLKTLVAVTGLAESPVPIKQGKISHGQPQNYYKAVLAGCGNVLECQTLAYYKQVIKNLKKPSTHTTGQKPAGVDDCGDSGDEICAPSQQSLARAAHVCLSRKGASS